MLLRLFTCMLSVEAAVSIRAETAKSAINFFYSNTQHMETTSQYSEFISIVLKYEL